MGQFFSIGVRHPVHDENLGTLMRTACSLGASYLFTIGRKYRGQASDTVKSYNQIPYIFFKDDQDFIDHIPYNCRVVCVENSDNARPIKHFCHFKRSIYLLGSETSGLPRYYTDKFPTIVLPGKYCHNVSLSGGLVMFDRVNKGESYEKA